MALFDVGFTFMDQYAINRRMTRKLDRGSEVVTMGIDLPASSQPDLGLDVFAMLQALEPEGRARLVLRLVQEHSLHRLELAAAHGDRAMLNDVDLSRQAVARMLGSQSAPSAAWWHAERQVINLRQADFRGASLRKVNLEGAFLEEANFSGADLAGATFKEAALAEADFRDAMLEEANLQGASLRFAQLQGTILEGTSLRKADLWGVRGAGALLAGADLREATLEEADLEGADLRGADLRGAILRGTNLRGANLIAANLQGAIIGGANLDGAILREAKLQGVVLSHCRLAHVHLSDTWLEKTPLQWEQIENAIGEELSSEYELARRGYLALERNFEALGDPDAARFAYRKKRRMQKKEAFQQAQKARRENRVGLAIRSYVSFASDQFVEWLCDYGESVWRVLGSLFAVYLVFAVIYGLTGGVVRVEGSVKTPTYSLMDIALFSLTAMSSPGNPPDYLQPRSEIAYLLASAQALLSIFLTGLLGFVAGNRIRR